MPHYILLNRRVGNDAAAVEYPAACPDSLAVAVRRGLGIGGSRLVAGRGRVNNGRHHDHATIAARLGKAMMAVGS